ncbi:MAG: trigger factor [Christensenellales bacterium]|jgi:trigger factor
MASTVGERKDNQVHINIEIDAETFRGGIDAAYKKNRGRYRVPGFRQGKAPRKMIENYYGEAVFYEAAFEEIYPQAYMDAVAEHKLEPVDYPQVSLNDIGPEGVKFSVDVTLKPEVALGDYKGIEATRREYTVSDADIDRELETIRERTARFAAVERAAQKGDTVLLDYSGSVDGVKFEGGTAERQELELGSGRFIPGFEGQLEGLSAGDEKQVAVTFPEEYHSEQLKGKEAVFAVKIHEVREKQVAELDDEFAKDVSEFDTLDEYKNSIRERLEQANAQKSDNELENELVSKVVENASVDIPQVMIDRQLDQLMQEFQYTLMYQGISIDDYYRITNTTEAQAREQYREEAQRRVKSQLVMEAIAKAENFEATQEDLDAEIAKSAEAAKKTVEAYKETLEERSIQYMKDRIILDKTMDLIRSGAAVTTEKVEPPAQQAEADEAGEEPAQEQAPEADEEPAAQEPAADKAPEKKAPAAKKAPAKKAPARSADGGAEKKAPAKKTPAKKAAPKADDIEG